MSDLPEDETIEDEDSPTIEASAEMQEALREATEAVEARKGEGGAGASGGSGDDGATPDKMTIELLAQELQDLKGLYEEKTKEFDEQQDRFLRLQAEFENFRRRGLKEKQESLQFGHQNLVKDLLSAVDDLERALEHGAQNVTGEVKGILDGVELVHREILAVLAKHGVSLIEAKGAVFDPAVHEAMGQLPSAEVPANTVLQVLQKGYLIRDRMLRPARVIVAREATAEEAAGQGEQA
ncbi:MAG: nucleotide exchange factor GrpE [Deltaproteobacteria bacterium]|nr:nucleotide exchange factor GrpE [Deltaproteobacteria bacterium]